MSLYFEGLPHQITSRNMLALAGTRDYFPDLDIGTGGYICHFQTYQITRPRDNGTHSDMFLTTRQGMLLIRQQHDPATMRIDINNLSHNPLVIQYRLPDFQLVICTPVDHNDMS